MTVCKQCQLWPLDDDHHDSYCSWCGCKLVGYTVTLEPSQLSLGTPQATVQLAIRNVGYLPLQLTRITADCAWVEVPEARELILAPDGVPVKLPVGIRHALLPAQVAQTAHIEVVTTNSLPPERVELQLFPAPQLHLDLSEYAVTLDSEPAERHDGRLILDSGYAHITGLEVDAPWLSLVADNPLPYALEEQQARELAFAVILDKSKLCDSLQGASAPDQPMRREVPVRVFCQELEEPLVTTFTVVCTWPPVLHIHGYQQHTPLEWRGFVGKTRSLSIIVENRGGAPLLLQSLTLQPPLPGLQLSEQTRFPMELAPNHAGSLLFVVADETQIPAGVYQTLLGIDTANNYPTAQVEVPLRFVLEEMPVYEGVVAIDFGTTNSCVVVCDRDRWAARMVPLESSVDRTVSYNFMPSVIRYERLLPHGQREYSVGTYAKNLAHLSSESTIESVKRLLGSRERLPVRFFHDGQIQHYLPEEIAADFVKKLLEHVEEELTHKITECVITHPSTFSPSQLHALQRVFASCGVSVNMMIHEPVAAALDYILNRNDSPGSYTLLVYDFGGGTTDLTLLEVEDSTDVHGHRMITPKVLGVGGRRHFGGEDITTALFKELCQQLKHSLQEDSEEEEMFLQPDLRSIYKIPEQEERAHVLRNYSVLRSLAEETKIKLSNDENRALQYEPFVTLLMPRPVSKSIQFTGVMLDNLIRHDLEDLLHTVQDMLDKAALQQPDIIVLSGQSSWLYLAKTLLQEAFTTSTIMWAGGFTDTTATPEHLKECVARGACRIAWLLDVPGPMELIPTHMQPMTTTRIGIASYTATGQPCFRTVLEAGDPLDTPKIIHGLGRLRRRMRITLLENTGSSDDLDSPEIDTLAVYDLHRYLPPHVTDKDLHDATLEMQLNKRYEVILTIVVNGQLYSFTTQRWAVAEEAD